MNNLKLFNKDILNLHGKRRNSHSIAVIGNGGVTPEDESMINSADVVIRFNNYATREGVRKPQDRFKCDILFSTFDLHSHGATPKDVVIGIPFPFKSKEIYDKPSRWYPKSRHWMINPFENERMCQELQIDSNGTHHPLPSLGFTALWHMRDWTNQIYVSGFNWYYDPTTRRVQKWDMRNTEYPNHWNHNYPKEVRWIINHLLPKNNIIFSSACSKILKSVISQIQ